MGPAISCASSQASFVPLTLDFSCWQNAEGTEPRDQSHRDCRVNLSPIRPGQARKGHIRQPIVPPTQDETKFTA